MPAYEWALAGKPTSAYGILPAGTRVGGNAISGSLKAGYCDDAAFQWTTEVK